MQRLSRKFAEEQRKGKEWGRPEGSRRRGVTHTREELGKRGHWLGGAAPARLVYNHRTQQLASKKVIEAQVVERTCPRVNSTPIALSPSNSPPPH